MEPDLILFFFIIITGMVSSVMLNKLTVTASLTGGLFAFFIFIGGGFSGIAMMAIFFIAGTAATSYRFKQKQQQGLAESNKGKRTAAQVAANSALAALLGLLMYLYPHYNYKLFIMLASCFSSATADTISSELGNVHGSRFYNILTMQKDKKGLNGVISVEGTFSGILGSMLIAATYFIAEKNYAGAIIIIVAGTMGNLSDSILGATLERSKYMGNNAVNFSNTVVAAASAYLLT